MRVTDEMVDAALELWHGCEEWWDGKRWPSLYRETDRAQMRVVLEAHDARGRLTHRKIEDALDTWFDGEWLEPDEDSDLDSVAVYREHCRIRMRMALARAREMLAALKD